MHPSLERFPDGLALKKVATDIADFFGEDAAWRRGIPVASAWAVVQTIRARATHWSL